jgi:outer membrane protein TolC
MLSKNFTPSEFVPATRSARLAARKKQAARVAEGKGLLRILTMAICASPASVWCQANQTPAPAATPLDPIPPVELPIPVPAASQLSLNQALQLGLRQNPQIAGAKSSIVSARENYNSQRSPLNPYYTYGALNDEVAPSDWRNGFSEGSNSVFYYTLETNGAQKYRSRQARGLLHQAEFDARTTGLSLSLGIIDAYVNLQTANRALEVELKVYGNIVKLGDLTNKRYLAGAGTQADAIRAHIAAIQEQQNVIQDVANVNSARAALRNQLGLPQEAPIDAVEPLVYKPNAVGELSELTRRAEISRPELRSANANLEALRAVPGLARSQYYPDLFLAKDLGSDPYVWVGINIPFDLGSIRGQVRKAEADVKTQLAQVETERESVDLDVKSSYINLAAAQKQVATYENGVLTMSGTLVEQVTHGYELGANTIVDVVTAENTYRSVESAYYVAVGNYVQALYALKHSIGDLPDAFSTTTLTPTNLAPTAPVSAAQPAVKQ